MPDSLTLQLQHTVVSHAATSPRTAQVAGMFGLAPAGDREVVIIPPTEITLGAGQVVFITGASGGGKSTLLRLICETIAKLPVADRPAVIRFDALAPAADRALVDGFDRAAPLADVLRWLSVAGLNDARVMLRRPGELSDGQRARLLLAHAIAQAERCDMPWAVVLADEFGATLDRPTARAVAAGVRKWATRAGVCVVAATTHDDLLEPLCPDVLIDKGPGAAIGVHVRETPAFT
ncbi:MAG: ABC transporter [Planctomycetota bacterium]